MKAMLCKIAVLLLVLSLLCPSVYGKTPEEAKEELAKMGIPYSTEDFIKKAAEGYNCRSESIFRHRNGCQCKKWKWVDGFDVGD